MSGFSFPAPLMYTQCPHCQAVFQVTTEELTASDGNVRCGECQLVFNGMDTLSVLPPEDTTPLEAAGAVVAGWPEDGKPGSGQATESTPEVRAGQTGVPQTPAALPESVSDTCPPVLTAGKSEPGPASPTASGDPLPAVPRAIQDELVSLRTGPAPRQLIGTLSLGVFILLLIGTLAGQAIYHERERLAAYPELAPLLQWMCARLDCTLPPQRDPQAFQLSERNIYSHPNATGALMVQATLVNKAGFAQPHPVVELSFRDLQGSVLAVRQFAPAEYLQRSEKNGPVAPGESVRLSLEIEDPGPQAVAYEFRFH